VTNLTVGEGIEKAGTSLGAGLAAFGKGIGKRREEERKKSKLEQSIVESEDLIESALERLDIDPKSKEGQFIKSGSIDPKTGLVDFQKFSAGVKISDLTPEGKLAEAEGKAEDKLGIDIPTGTPRHEIGELLRKDELQKSVEKEAAVYGVFREPGESLGDLSKRSLEAKMDFAAKQATRTENEKDILEAQQVTLRGILKTSSMSNAWVDMVLEQSSLTGIPIGPALGLSMIFTDPVKFNEFEEAFTGTSNDWAASQVATHMKGSRASILMEKFKKSKPGKFSTIPSGINNLAKSYEGIISVDMAQHPQAYMPEGHEFRNVPADHNYLKSKLEMFSRDYKQGMYESIYQRASKLIPKEKIKEFNLIMSTGKMKAIRKRHNF